MSFNKKLNIVFVLTALAFTLLFAIMILGYFFQTSQAQVLRRGTFGQVLRKYLRFL